MFGGGYELLSDSSFTVVRSFHPSDMNPSFPTHTAGFLDIYQFDPEATVPTPPVHVASLGLPHETGETIDNLQIRTLSSPALCHSDLKNGGSPAAKIFDMAPGSRMLLVDIAAPSNQDRATRTQTYTLLYVPAPVLLDVFEKYTTKGSDHLVPWADWGDRAMQVKRPGLDSPFLKKSELFGQRLCTPFPETGNFLVLDFDQRRLKSCSVSSPDYMHNLSVYLEVAPLRYSIRYLGPCTKPMVRLQGIDWDATEKSKGKLCL